MKEGFMPILGIKTKGGFPTIEVFLFEDLERIESPHRFYDQGQATFYVFSEGFFYSYTGGDDRVDDYERGMMTIHKALFPNSKLTYDEEIARARQIAGLPPRERKGDFR